ncbi:MAG: hypothetical protein KF894_21575 [Labilithrix sp.]|nr:hypothetical protein [Labilithrix sp.]
MIRRAGLLLALVIVACDSKAIADPAGAPPDAATAPQAPAPATAPPLPEPSLEVPEAVTIDEETEGTIAIDARNLRRVDVGRLPPGARFDRAASAVVFRPDFTQSGTYTIQVTGHAAGRAAPLERTVTVEVRDAVSPPAPVVTATTTGEGWTRLTVRQTTDTFLDSAGRAGRTFDAVVVVPTAATAQSRAPVRVSLHGFGGAPSGTTTSTSAFVVAPHDPSNTYWWGYGEGMPAAIGGSVPAYTQRRVLHLLAWLLATYPGADPERVFTTGGSMGGAGALTLGLLHARHFAGVDATIAPTIPKNHRPSRVTQLATLWGTIDADVGGVWDRMDLTRALRDDPEARDQFVFTKHGKDDPTIHFGAVLTPSPLTKKSFYETLESEHIGHLAVWDEGAHGPEDPVMGERWWDSGWSRVTDAKAFLRRDLPFPAFSRSSANEDPGDGGGNGKVTFDPESGYAANVGVAGDTGWSGAVAGSLNRFLRWDATRFVDARDRLVMPLFLASGAGAPSPQAGYPTRGDQRSGDGAIEVHVTPRRATFFRPLPGETVRFRFGSRTGTVTAAADGSVTVPGVAVTSTETTLELERDPP